MRIYEYKPPYLIRLQIAKSGMQTEYITLQDTTLEAVRDMVKGIIEKQMVSALVTGRVTSVNIRESVDGKNGKVMTVSFRGIDPKKTLELIESHLEEKKKEA